MTWILRLVVGLIPSGILFLGMAYSLLGFDVFEYLPPLSLCYFRTITTIPCPGCGMGRALLSLSQMDFTRATSCHPFAFPLFLGCVVYALRGKLPFEKYHRHGATGALILVMLFWVEKLYHSGF